MSSAALSWLLRRLRQGTPIQTDLVLLRDHAVLQDVPDGLMLDGKRWGIARVTGEFTLRAALLAGEPLIAVLVSEASIPLDLIGRAYLGRPIRLQAHDVIAGLAGEFCQPILDADLAAAVVEHVDALAAVFARWPTGRLVTAADVTSALASAELGMTEHLKRTAPAELLAGWIQDGLPTTARIGLLSRALRAAHSPEGLWLEAAVLEGSLTPLLGAGALCGGPEGLALAPSFPGLQPSDHTILQGMVEEALRSLPADVARDALAPVEAAATSLDVGIEAAAHYPLLLAPARAAVQTALRRALHGEPPDDDALEALRANLYAEDLLPELSLAQEACRLARFLNAVQAPAGSLPAWSQLMWDQIAWADWSLRRFRQRLAAVPLPTQTIAADLLEALIQRRTALNRTFAEALQGAWKTASTNRDRRELLPLSQLSRCLLRPLLDDGHRIFLVVLDGCDLSTFIELLSTTPQTSEIGLTLPEVTEPTLRSDLLSAGAFQVALALLPTVTSHSRRAIFAGEVPGNPTLTDTEAAAANASADKVALKRNTALSDIERTLFLKGDLTDGALPAALRSDQHRLIAAVFNGIDDALSSRQTTPLGPWRLADLGGGALQAIETAVEADWTIIVTSDHGHTPHLDSGRKRAPRALSARYDDKPQPGALRFELAHGPLHLLCEPGAWFGHQHRGHHGGAGLEEVLVPLAFLGKVPAGSGRPTLPTWWRRTIKAPIPRVQSPLPLPPSPPPVTPPPPTVNPPTATPPPDWAAQLPDDATRRIFQHIVAHGAITEAEATGILGSPRMFRKFNRRFEDNASRVPFRTRVEQTASGKRYVYVGG